MRDTRYGEIETRALLEDKICERHRVASVQIVVQGGYGTFKTVEHALQRGCQVLLVEDSGGAAQVISELVAPMLAEAATLPEENFVRDKRVRSRIHEYAPAKTRNLPRACLYVESTHDPPHACTHAGTVRAASSSGSSLWRVPSRCTCAAPRQCRRCGSASITSA